MVWRWAVKKAAFWEVDCWQCAAEQRSGAFGVSDAVGKQQWDGVFIMQAGLHWGENFEVNSGDGCTRSIQCNWASAVGRKSLMEVACRRTYPMHTDFQPAVRRSKTRTPNSSPYWAGALFVRKIKMGCPKKCFFCISSKQFISLSLFFSVSHTHTFVALRLRFAFFICGSLLSLLLEQ